MIVIKICLETLLSKQNKIRLIIHITDLTPLMKKQLILTKLRNLRQLAKFKKELQIKLKINRQEKPRLGSKLFQETDQIRVLAE